MTLIEGKVWKYGDAINTDVIFPGKYTYTVQNRSEMARHALEDLDPEFAEGVQPGDVIVAGTNFGCGSSREQAVICLKESGLGAIVAASFARIYYRNCINSALPALICPALIDHVEGGDRIAIHLEEGFIECESGRYPFQPFTGLVDRIFKSGGLIPYTRAVLQGKQEP